MLNDCVPQDVRSPVHLARVYPIPPSDDALTVLRKPMAADVLTEYAQLVRELKYRRINFELPRSIENPERLFIGLVNEFKETAALAWSGDLEALAHFPTVVREFCSASMNFFGSTEWLAEDLDVAYAAAVTAQKVAKAIPLDRTAKGCRTKSDDQVREALREEIGKRGKPLSVRGAEAFCKLLDPGLARQDARRLNTEISGTRPPGRPKQKA